MIKINGEFAVPDYKPTRWRCSYCAVGLPKTSDGLWHLTDGGGTLETRRVECTQFDRGEKR